MNICDFDFNCFSYAIDDIFENVQPDETYTLDDLINEIENYEFENIEADVYTSDLLAWLQEDLNNTFYCDDGMDEFQPKTFTDILTCGQQRAKEEKYNACKDAVVSFLSEFSNDDNE